MLHWYDYNRSGRQSSTICKRIILALDWVLYAHSNTISYWSRGDFIVQKTIRLRISQRRTVSAVSYICFIVLLTHLVYSVTRVMASITTSSTGLSPAPTSDSSIAVTTSIPSTTSPNTVCFVSRKLFAFTFIKN